MNFLLILLISLCSGNSAGPYFVERGSCDLGTQKSHRVYEAAPNPCTWGRCANINLLRLRGGKTSYRAMLESDDILRREVGLLCLPLFLDVVGLIHGLTFTFGIRRPESNSSRECRSWRTRGESWKKTECLCFLSAWAMTQ
jgi:hypothetical protein